jgi:UDP-N-acetylglucosamine--N-acetylmuramyl-(pentapeptide) pyrophosphoryl-undecaprenol N-acetylglucosamine transferase
MKKLALKIAVCSGGTGGHMFPACAIFEGIKQRGHSVSIITDMRGNAFCKNIDEKFVVDTIRFSKKKLCNSIYEFLCLFFKFVKFYKNNPVDVIVGFGGLFTVIPLLIAKIFGAKIILYEQNAILGKANKFLMFVANLKLSTFNINEKWIQVLPPVRKSFLEVSKEMNDFDEIIRIVVIGGSQGALSFCNILPNAFSLIDKSRRACIEIIQQAVEEKIDELRNKYESLGIKCSIRAFIDDVAKEMANAHLVICRAGASTLAELSAIGRPAILIPYPLASDNHQFFNATHYKNKNAAWIVEESKNPEKELSNIINNIFDNRELLKTYTSNMIDRSISESADTFVKHIEKVSMI